MENNIRTPARTYADSGYLLTGLFLGGVVGFGAMLLLTPQSGNRTRGQIRQKSTEMQERTTDTLKDWVTLSRFDHREILIGTQRKT